MSRLLKIFNLLKVYNMRLNLNKCALKVWLRKFLEFMVNQRDIKANPNKIKVILKMKVSQTPKQV